MLIFDQLKKSEPQLRVFSLLVLGGLSTLMAGLWHVQVISAKQYQANLDSQSYRTVRVPAVRGQIFDRNGRVLAANRAGFTVNVYLDDLRHLFRPEFERLRVEREQELDRKLTRAERAPLEPLARFNVINNAAQQVARVIQRPIKLDSIKVNTHWIRRRALPMPIAEKLTPAEVARFAESPFDHPGVNLDSQLQRHYPHNETAAHVLGYLKTDNGAASDIDSEFDYPLPGLKGGGTGVESVFDRYLQGEPGGKSVLIDHIGYRRNESMDQEPLPGDDLYLTLDLDIQKIAEEELKSKVGRHVRGAVVVMNPRNGDVLALVSLPAFDPNRFPGVSHEYYNFQNAEPRAAFRCRATQNNFQPGSIFKIVVALACLEKGTMTPHEIYHNKGYIQVGRRFDDTARPGPYDFRRAFIKSSNSYFIHHGLEARVRTVIEMGNRFFLGQPTKIPTWQDYAGNFPKLDIIRPGKWFDGDTANLCIGQGPIDMTPLQAAIMTSAVSNGGTVYWPRLVERIAPHKSRAPRKGRFNPPGKIRGHLNVAPRNQSRVLDAMLADVEDSEGTGNLAAVPGMRIGGKTGTAEEKKGGVVIDKKTWFVSFGRYPGEDQPRYVVVVLVESGGSGGKTSAPVAGAIYRRLYERDKPSLQVANALSHANN